MDDALDAVPWSQLSHAYGSAADVPQLLRDVASRDVVLADAALHDLFGNILHQHTVYEATAYAIPFLAALASRRDIHQRSMIVALIAACANGRSYLDVHGKPRFLSSEQFEKKRAKELEFVRSANRAVCAEYERFAEMTEEEDEWIRLAAAHVLVFLGQPVRSGAILRKLVGDSSSEARAGFCILLGMTRDCSVETMRLLESELESESELVKLGATLGIVHSGAPLRSPAIMEAIAGLSLVAEPAGPFAGKLPWDVTAESGLSELIEALDAATRRKLAERYFSALENRQMDVFESSANLDPMLEIAFGEPSRSHARIEAEHLDDLQRLAVRALLAAGDSVEAALGYDMTWLGLPETREGMTRLLDVG